MDTPPSDPVEPETAKKHEDTSDTGSGHAIFLTAAMIGVAGAGGANPRELGFLGFMIAFGILMVLGRVFAWLFGYIGSIAMVIAGVLWWVIFFNVDRYESPGLPTLLIFFLVIATILKGVQLIARAKGRSGVAN